MENIEQQMRSMMDQQLPLDEDTADMTDICLTTHIPKQTHQGHLES